MVRISGWLAAFLFDERHPPSWSPHEGQIVGIVPQHEFFVGHGVADLCLLVGVRAISRAAHCLVGADNVGEGGPVDGDCAVSALFAQGASGLQRELKRGRSV